MRYLTAGKGNIATVFFTPDHSSLVCVETGEHRLHYRAVHWFDPRTGEHQRTLDLCDDAWRNAISYAEKCTDTGHAFVSPDGRWVAVHRYIDDRGKFNLWDGKSEKWRDIDLEDAWRAGGVCFSAQDDLLYTTSTGTAGKSLERLNLKTNRRLPAIGIPEHYADHLRLNADESRIAVVAAQRTINGIILTRPYARDRADVGTWLEFDDYIGENAVIQFSPDGTQLAIMNVEEVLFWDWETQKAAQMPTERVRFTDLVYSPDGRFFALACADGTVRLHDCTSTEVITGQDRRIRFDDCVIYEEVKRYDWGIGSVGCVAFASDGLTAAAGGANGRVVVWDLDM